MRFSLALVALLLGISLGCGGSTPSTTTSPSTPAPSGTAVSIVVGARTLTTTAYSPNPVTVAVGGTVTWTNNDSITHTSVSDTGVWNSGGIGAGQSFSQTFSTAGTYPYHCSIHPGMVGTITVQ
jgi:plastocyanin